jgi:immune inhibitor A
VVPTPVVMLTPRKPLGIIAAVRTRRVVLFLSLVGLTGLAPLTLGAVPALPKSMWLDQPTGERLPAYPVGDERAFFWVTPEGWVLRPAHEGGYEYWTELHDGKAPPRPTALPGVPSRHEGGAPGSPPPVAGEVPLLVVAVHFSDREADMTLEDVGEMIAGTEQGSLNHYYTDASCGQLQFVVTMPQEVWYMSSRTMSYYGEDTYPGVDNANGYISELAREALTLADGDVDFGSFDANSNGRLDAGEVHIIIVHAGPDQANDTTHPEYIWSHRWWIWGAPYGLPDTHLDGVLVSEPNLQGNEASPGYVIISEVDPLGVIAHEMLHSLGAPDLYDPNEWPPASPVGEWCLMGLGVWNGSPPGALPCHPCGYLKMDANADPTDGLGGWVSPTELVFPGEYALQHLESDFGERLYIARIQGEEEYFVLENRLRDGYDGALPGQGMLIFHIDEDMPDYNEEPDPLFPRVSLEDPAGTPDKRTAAFSLESGYTAFTPETDPSSASNDGEESGIYVDAIGSYGEEMSFTFSSEAGAPSASGLVSCYPNPFDEHCSFVLFIGEDVTRSNGPVDVRLDIHDIAGRRLCRVWEGALVPGTHTIGWDRHGTGGMTLPAGLYVAVATVRDLTTRRRVLLVPHEGEAQ